MAVRDLTDAGSNSYVAALLNSGYDRPAIEERLHERYPEATARDVRTAYDYGRQAWSAATELSVGGEDQTVPASHVPRGQAGQTGYLYTTTVTIHQIGEGTAPGEFGTRQVEVQSATPLSLGQLRDQADRAVQFLYRPAGGYQAEDRPTGEFWVEDFDVISIERI